MTKLHVGNRVVEKTTNDIGKITGIYCDEPDNEIYQVVIDGDEYYITGETLEPYPYQAGDIVELMGERYRVAEAHHAPNGDVLRFDGLELRYIDTEVTPVYNNLPPLTVSSSLPTEYGTISLESFRDGSSNLLLGDSVAIELTACELGALANMAKTHLEWMQDDE